MRSGWWKQLLTTSRGKHLRRLVWRDYWLSHVNPIVHSLQLFLTLTDFVKCNVMAQGLGVTFCNNIYMHVCNVLWGNAYYICTFLIHPLFLYWYVSCTYICRFGHPCMIHLKWHWYQWHWLYCAVSCNCLATDTSIYQARRDAATVAWKASKTYYIKWLCYYICSWP